MTPAETKATRRYSLARERNTEFNFLRAAMAEERKWTE